MSTGINIASSSGLTVGTTTVTSGTDGRVFFQAGGVVQQDANFTFDNTLKRLTLKAVNTAATDIPFAVQNSAGTVNLLQQNGVGSILARSNDTFSYAGLFYRTDGTNGFSLTNSHSGYGLGTGIETVGNNGVFFRNNGNRAFGITTYSTGSFKTYGIWNYGSDAGQRLLIGENIFDPQVTLSGTGNLGIGTYTAGARLDVRAADGLSNAAFRVRNSADTANIFTVSGNNTIKLLSDPASTNGIAISAGAFGAPLMTFSDVFSEVIRISAITNTVKAANFRSGSETGIAYMGIVNPSSQNRFLKFVDAFGNEYISMGGSNYDGGGGVSFTLKTTTNTGANFITFSKSDNTNKFVVSDQANVGIGQDTFGTSSKFVLAIASGVAPTTSPVDAFQQYSADVVAGNAAPHFRTEVGDIIKLYKQSSAGITTVADLVTVLTNLGLLG